MKAYKKLFAIMFVVVVLVSVLPFSVYADTAESVANVTFYIDYYAPKAEITGLVYRGNGDMTPFVASYDEEMPFARIDFLPEDATGLFILHRASGNSYTYFFTDSTPMSIDNKILTGLNIGGGSIEDDQWMSYEEWKNAQLERVTIYLECPNGELVQKDTVGGTFFYKSRDLIYIPATLDESGLYKFSVPYPRDLENMTFDYKVNNSDIGTSLSVYYYHRIVDYKYYDGLCLKNFQYLRGMLEPTFTDGIWANYETGQLIGDVDRSGELNVKDATYIQKCLVGSEAWSDEGEVLPSGLVRYMADFNLDGERNVKDATLIQKYVAA